jgi:hypothetical protein
LVNIYDGHETYSFFLLLAVAMKSLCYANVTKLSAEDRRMLQDSPRFHEVHSTRDLPLSVIALCADDGRIAEPGQKWNATDSIMDPTLPGKRLIWAAIGGEYYVVHLRTRRNRSHVPHLGCQNHEG